MDWDSISKQPGLSEDFIRDHKEYVNWEHISKQQRLSNAFIVEMEEKIHFTFLSYNPNLTRETIKQFFWKLDCTYVLVHHFPLEEETFQRMRPYLDWREAFFIFKETIGFVHIKSHRPVTVFSEASSKSGTPRVIYRGTTMIVYEEKNGWYRIGQNAWIHGNPILMDFIKEKKNKILYQKSFLSFLQTYQNHVDWEYMFDMHAFSEEELKTLALAVKWNQKIWDFIVQTQNLSESFMETYYDKLSWKLIAEYQTFSSSFAKKYETELGEQIVKHVIKIENIQHKEEKMLKKTKKESIWSSFIKKLSFIK